MANAMRGEKWMMLRSNTTVVNYRSHSTKLFEYYAIWYGSKIASGSPLWVNPWKLQFKWNFVIEITALNGKTLMRNVSLKCLFTKMHVGQETLFIRMKTFLEISIMHQVFFMFVLGWKYIFKIKEKTLHYCVLLYFYILMHINV